MSRLFLVFLRIVAAGAFATFMSLSVIVPATAQSNGFQHFMDCLGWMFSDPGRHASDCSPGHEWTGPFSNAYGFQAPQPAAPTTSCLDSVPAAEMLRDRPGFDPQILHVVDCVPCDVSQLNPDSFDQAFLLQVASVCDEGGSNSETD